MKNLLFILFAFVLFSCDNTEIKVENPEKITTVEIQIMAQQDSLTYKKVYLNDVLYLVNKDNQIEYSISNYSGVLGTVLLFILFLFIVIIVILRISTNL